MQRHAMKRSAMDRREFMGGATLAAAGALLMRSVAFAGTAGGPRLVVIIMRGALDGLAAVPPWGDPDYARLRGALAIGAPGGTDGALPLDGMFGLHPSLAFLHEAYGAGELVVCHAAASAYRERSHFDGQDVLESGFATPHASMSGWLNRALAALPAVAARPTAEPGIAIGANVPLLLRGPAPVASWSPTRLSAVDEDTLQRITDLYAQDPQLSQRLAEALTTDAMAGDGDAQGMGALSAASASSAAVKPANNQYAEVVRAAAGFLGHEDGPRVAVFDTTGWDTHQNEGGARGQLANRLGALDAGLRLLKQQSEPVWRNTAVIAVTEFGRTAAVNGTGGSDHGTGTVAFLMGGAVNGGRVVADWPGLSQKALYQQRDLVPTLDLRALLKGVLADHLGVPQRALDDKVFPGSGGVKPLRDLIRA